MIKILLISLILSGSVNHEIQSKLFQKYLNDFHKAKIEKAEVKYYIIRQNNCYKCHVENLNLAKRIIKDKNVKIIYVYNGRINKEAEFIRKSRKVLLDSTEAFLKININPFSDCVIRTTNGKISKITQINNE